MADTQTPNYGLYKIGSANDSVGTHMPDHYNANQDAVDAALAENASDITSHTENSNIHVTAAQKSAWTAKQDAIPANTYDAYGAAADVMNSLSSLNGVLAGNGSTVTTKSVDSAPDASHTSNLISSSGVANALAKEIIKVALGSQTGTGGSVTWSKSSASITAEHEVLAYELGTPAAQTGNLTWTTSAGAISVSGAVNGTTTLTVILGIVGTTVT